MSGERFSEQLAILMTVVIRLICVLCALVLWACEDFPYPVADPVVRLKAELSQTVLEPVQSQGAGSPDSIVVTRVRMIVRDVRLHTERADSTAYRRLADGPLLMTAVGPGAPEAYAGLFPLGIYDAMRVRLSRLSDEEAARFGDDPDYADFITSERHSCILEGAVYRGGDSTAFRYTAAVDSLLVLPFDSPVGVPRGSVTDLLLVLRIPEMFRSEATLLDPTDDRNKPVLDSNLTRALKAAKHDS